MKWNFKPVSLIKKTAASLSIVTMCIAPVAQGAAAENQKKMINEYLRETGLTTKKMTVGEFWRMVRHVYPHHLQKQMDIWVQYNRNELMPAIEANTFKDANGKEQVRLTLTKDGQSTNLTFTGDEDTPLKVNNVAFAKKELLNYKNFNDIAKKLVEKDATIGKSMKNGNQGFISKQPVLTIKEFKQLSARQKAEYLVRLRQTAEAAQRVYETRYGKQALLDFNNKYEFALKALFGDDAFAASNLTGKPCIVAGYISKYGENGSCGGATIGTQDLKNQQNANRASCANNGVACNPLVYGFNQGGGAFCVARANIKYATRECNGMSPLNGPQDKKRIIESYLKGVKDKSVDLKLNEEGKVSEAQYAEIADYLTAINGFVNQAVLECGRAPLKDVQVSREDQASACTELSTRAMDLQKFATDPTPNTPTVPAPEPPVTTIPNNGNCSEQMTGSSPSADGKTCVCNEGEKAGEMGEEGRRTPACVIGGGGASGTGAKDSCGFWCRNKSWIIPVGVGVLALGLFWWLFSKDKKKSNKSPEYVPPAPVPEPTPTTPTTPTTPVVENPPPAPCPSPNTLVNGICTPPVVVPPPVVTTEGGTKTDTPGRAGGVR